MAARSARLLRSSALPIKLCFLSPGGWLFRKATASEQDRKQRFKKFRRNLHRGRRLDLCTVARGVLPREAGAGEGAGIRRVKTDLNRDQWHLLRLAEAGELSQMGARGA